MAPRHAKGLPTLALRDEDPEVSAMSLERAKPRTTRSLDIPIARIRPNPFQARRAFDDLHELVATIRSQGFTTRLRVRHDPSDPKYLPTCLRRAPPACRRTGWPARGAM